MLLPPFSSVSGAVLAVVLPCEMFDTAPVLSILLMQQQSWACILCQDISSRICSLWFVEDWLHFGGLTPFPKEHTMSCNIMHRISRLLHMQSAEPPTFKLCTNFQDFFSIILPSMLVLILSPKAQTFSTLYISSVFCL